MDQHMNSVSAMRSLMISMGLKKSEKLEFDVCADLFNKKNRQRGNIQFKINSNWHSGDGPYLDFDETIKGFGIHFTKFEPKWQEMTWDRDEFTLTVKDPKNSYEFSLAFTPTN